jgi:hypothetical protein
LPDRKSFTRTFLNLVARKLVHFEGDRGSSIWRWTHQRGCSSCKKLVRAGLKTIVVMAGVCALQTNPHIVQPILRLYHESLLLMPVLSVFRT